MATGGRDRTAGAASALLLVLVFAGCLGDRPTGLDQTDGDGGSGGAGGLPSGGASGKGGGAGKGSGGASAGTGGTAVGSGGTITGNGGAGGPPGTGGATATGGTPGTGGATATGGTTGTGGATATGGAKGTGGVVATGGVIGTGGVVATGGVTGTGGIIATGGVTGTGGIIATGGVTGTGGAAPVCSLGQSHCVNNDTQEEDCLSTGQWGPASTCQYACVGTTCGGMCTPGTMQCSGLGATQLCGSNAQLETAVACPLPAPPNPSCSSGHCAYHAGVDSSGGSDTLPVSYVYAMRFMATANTKAYRLGMFGTATGGFVRLGLYSESTVHMPNTLLVQTTSTVATANGAMEGAINTTTLTANTYYWIAAVAETNTDIGVTQGGEGFVYNNASTYPAMPTTFPATGDSSDSAETPDFYVVLQDQ